MAARDEGYYWKEIIGTLIWIALLVWLLRSGGVERFRQWIDETEARSVLVLSSRTIENS